MPGAVRVRTARAKSIMSAAVVQVEEPAGANAGPVPVGRPPPVLLVDGQRIGGDLRGGQANLVARFSARNGYPPVEAAPALASCSISSTSAFSCFF